MTAGMRITQRMMTSQSMMGLEGNQSRLSDVQRRMMTTATEPNVHAVAVEGTFDDCQALVKAMFGDLPFRDRLQLAAVNSINWGRIVAQLTYYFAASAALVRIDVIEH